MVVPLTDGGHQILAKGAFEMPDDVLEVPSFLRED